jgi:hypothetical protein
VSAPTARHWLSILEASFIAFRLPSYHGNVSKRLIKMPKLHFYDSGLACWLLGIRDAGQLNVHPLRGAIFESWVVSEIIKNRFNHGELNGVYFFRDKAGLESDALVMRKKTLALVEVKTGQTLASDLATSVGLIAGLFGKKKQATADRQERNGVTFLPWHAVQDYPWAG